jgi:hypothetical protein
MDWIFYLLGVQWIHGVEPNDREGWPAVPGTVQSQIRNW